jgi:hypothetical protein
MNVYIKRRVGFTTTLGDSIYASDGNDQLDGGDRLLRFEGEVANDSEYQIQLTRCAA